MKILLANEKIEIPIAPGETILKSLLNANIPHKHVCGGNARCSTCRIMVTSGLQNTSPRNELETALSAKKGFPEHIRLACQTTIHGDIQIRRLILDEADAEIATSNTLDSVGQEKEIAILFSDIRGFTHFAEKNLPYDVIHILNRYFYRVGEAIYNQNGYIDKYIGDGIMALFGIDGNLSSFEITKSAILSALGMLEALEDLNHYLMKNFQVSFTIGIGIHYGVAILGNLGHPKKMQLTAVGDSVNFASRIEQATKETETSILISEPVYNLLKDRLAVGRSFQKEIKGKSGFYNLYEVNSWKNHDAQETLESIKLNSLQHHTSKYVFRYNAASFVRMVFHESFEKKARGLFQFAEALIWDENQKLGESAGILNKIKIDLENSQIRISHSDILAYCSIYAIQICGGPKIPFQLGRKDCSSIPQRPNLPEEKDSFHILLDKYERNGFSLQDFVALNGAHTLGRAYGKEFTKNPHKFDGSFFQLLLERELQKVEVSPVKSDSHLLSHSECRKLVEMYALDESRFFQDFQSAFEKLVSLV